jgi:hypothetical protein
LEAVLLTVAGLHVPVIPFDEVVDNVGATSPAQIDVLAPKLNVGVRIGFTVTVNVAGLAHNPGLGVKTYEPEFWLSTTEGLHVPLTPLVDVLGNVGTVPLPHITRLVPKGNVGVVLGVTVTVIVVTIPHCPVVGVNV